MIDVKEIKNLAYLAHQRHSTNADCCKRCIEEGIRLAVERNNTLWRWALMEMHKEISDAINKKVIKIELELKDKMKQVIE